MTATLKWLSLAAAVIALGTLTSCSAGGPQKVVIDNADGDTCTLVFDGKTTVRMVGDTTHVIELKPGKHSVVINNGQPREFKVGSKGGLLNLDNVDYIAYQVEYAPQTSYGNDRLNNIPSARIKSMVVIDSFLVSEKGRFNFGTAYSDSALRNMLPTIISDPDGTIMPRNIQSDGFYGLKKFGKGQFFIDKFWDYNMTEEMPETIEIKTRKGDFVSSSTRSQFARANHFLVMAMINRDVYQVRSFESIRSGKKPVEDDMDAENEDDAIAAPEDGPVAVPPNKNN